MPALDAGNWITLGIALISAAAAWGSTRQDVADLKRRITAAEGTRDEVIRLQEQVKALVEAMKDLRDDIRAARPASRKAAVSQ